MHRKKIWTNIINLLRVLTANYSLLPTTIPPFPQSATQCALLLHQVIINVSFSEALPFPIYSSNPATVLVSSSFIALNPT